MFIIAAVALLESLPWIGDGRPERNGADWYDEDPAPEFCAEFTLPPGVTETKIRFACAGYGYFYMHGGFMSPNGLEPLWSVYDKTVYSFCTRTLKATSDFDIWRPTYEQSKLGFELNAFPRVNKVYVRLGNGFYNLPPLRFWSSICFREHLAHGRPCFKLAVEGVKEPLQWKWRETNVIRNSPYLGTEIDATRSVDEDWKPAAEVKGPKGEIVEWPRTNPQMGTFDIHFGKSTWLKEGEVQVVDFGANSSGVPDFVFRDEERGNRIEIVYGERLNEDGSVNVLTQTAGQIKHGNGGPGAPAVACQRDVYTCRGPRTLPPMTGSSADLRAERFIPPFTWHVFRYAEIRGAKHLVVHAIRNVQSMRSIEFGGHDGPAAKAFKTENADLRAIHEMCRRTFQANLIGGVQSDCPGRERLGYGGDIVATCEALCLNFDMKELYLKILRDFADEASVDGWITETAPFVGIADADGIESHGKQRKGPISWALVVPVLMDMVIRHYPDAKDRALAFYPTCTRYVALVDAANPSGIVPKCIGDHEALERAPDTVTATAHWYEFVRLTAKFAAMLGKDEDAKKYTALAEKVRGAFAAAFVKDGKVANGTQSAQSIALYLGLVPADQIPAAEKLLVEAIHAKGDALSTGLFSTRYMLMYLSKHGELDLARKIVLHKGFPGWMHMLERGATTLWETWAESDDVYSNCHPMFGSVDEWILKYGK